MLEWAPSALFSAVSLASVGLSFLLPETYQSDMPEELDFFTSSRKRSKTPEDHLHNMTSLGHSNPVMSVSEGE